MRESKISDIKHYEGMSSDDEETEADITRFHAERGMLIMVYVHNLTEKFREYSMNTKLVCRSYNARC